jgi:hypothetical protein
MHDREGWIEHRLQELARVFSVAVAGFAILDNHLHVLVRLDRMSPAVVGRERGATLGTPLSALRQGTPADPGLRGLGPIAVEGRQAGRDLARAVAKPQIVMKCLNEPLSRLANREEQTRGAFFEGRFKNVAILDEES